MAEGCGVTPKVTVLMPAHNGGQYIREAIDSILAQSFTEFEFLIINDGSIDNSLSIVGKYSDPRIRVVTSHEKRGLVYSLNHGLSLARGEYVARMDCDDLSLPHRLEKQVRFMDANPAVAISGGGIEAFGAESYVKRYPGWDEAIRAHMLFGSPFAHPTIIMRRDSIIKENLAYNGSSPHAEDYEFWSRIPRSLKLANLPEVLLKYRLHKDQVTSSFREKQLSSTNRIRMQKLKEIGLDISDLEFDVHVRIARRESNSSLEFIDSAQKWLMKIYDANSKTGSYQESAMLEILGLFWWEACFNSSGLGIIAWKRFKLCELAPYARIDLKHRMAFIVKCLLRHKGRGRSAYDHPTKSE